MGLGLFMSDARVNDLIRPFNDDEVRTSAPQVVTCNETRREVTVNLNIAAKQIDRTFTFDKASFWPFCLLASFLGVSVTSHLLHPVFSDSLGVRSSSTAARSL